MKKLVYYINNVFVWKTKQGYITTLGKFDVVGVYETAEAAREAAINLIYA